MGESISATVQIRILMAQQQIAIRGLNHARPVEITLGIDAHLHPI